ncbi:MAG: zinc-binding dehydrogenase [Gammaproteobacteria bacterium]|nr:zinc-binding dehydrogenase [Gammaproteobacteria bacterium]
MRAVLTTEHGDRSVLVYDKNFAAPKAKDNEVVLDVRATAVNFHDIFTRRGMPGVPIDFPLIVGSDIAGVVRSVGSGVDKSWIDKPVLVDPVFRGGDRFGMIGETCHGGRAEQVAVPASQLIALPEGVDFEAAAALPLAYGTAWRMMVTRGKVAAGESVLILGASGGVGVACVQIAKLLGASVIACTSSESKARRLRELGADHVVNYSQTSFRDAVRKIVGKPRVVGGGGVDVAINFTGGDTLLDTQKSVSLGGRILTCGATAGYELEIDARYWWTFEHEMIGSNGWSVDDLTSLLDLIVEGRLAPVIDKILPLEDCSEAERMLEDREVLGKVLIRP